MNVLRSLTAGAVLAMLCGRADLGAADRRLADAAKDQDSRAVQALLKQGADVNGTQGDGSTALHWAVHWDDGPMTTALIAAKANVNAATDQGITPLALAASNGSGTMVSTLLKAGADPNLASTVGETPLMRAAHAGSAEAVTQLLERGAKLDARESGLEQTALMHAVVENHADVVRVLVKRGADPRARSTNKFTPLLFAAQQGNVEIAKILLEAGASVDESAPDGIAGDTNSTRSFKAGTDAAVLLVAIDSGHEELARFLLEAGANPNHEGAGRTALHAAVQQKMPTLVSALLTHGANPNARLTKALPLLSRFIGQQTGLETSTNGATPFWLAASYGDLETMKILIAGKADPRLTTDDRTNALMVAAGVDFVEGQDKYGRRWFTTDTTVLQNAARDAVQYCLDLGLDINAANDKGQTALHGAVYFGGTLLVPFLHQRGANLNAINKRGQTPWLITQGEYQAGSFIVHKETGDVLAALGADTTLGTDIGREAVSRLLRQPPQ